MGFSTLQRYFIRNFFSHFALAILVLSFLIGLVQLFSFQSQLSYGIGVLIWLKISFHGLVSTAYVLLPIAFLYACLITLLFSMNQNEILAMKATGISPFKLLYPLCALGIGFYFLCVFIYGFVQPYSYSAMKDIVTHLLEEKKISFLREGVFNEKIFGYVIYIHHIDKKEEILNDIVIFNKDENQNDYLIIAKRGSMQRDPQLNVSYMHLEDGSYTSLEDSFQHIEFKKAQVKVAHEEILSLGSPEKKLNLWELWQKRNDIREARFWFYNKLFMALAPLIFGLFIFGLVLNQSRFRKSWSFIIILGGLFIYYGAMMNLRYKTDLLQNWLVIVMLLLHILVFSLAIGMIYRARQR